MRSEVGYLVFAMVVVALVCQAFSPTKVEPVSWGIRSDYFDPRAGKEQWLDELSTLGTNLLCNSHVATRNQKAWHNRGVHLGPTTPVLEIDIRFRNEECDQFLPFDYSPFALPVQGKKAATVFLDEKSVGKATLDLQPRYHFSSEPVPTDFRRVHFKLVGLEEEQLRQLQASVEACPIPQPYESDFDPRTGKDRVR